MSGVLKNILETGRHLDYTYYITHSDLGFRCGYVSLPPGHPWTAPGVDLFDIDVHGDVTFDDDDPLIKNNYLVGFDCGHSGDAPDPELVFTSVNLFAGGIIRSQEYVRAECFKLIEQAEAAVTFRDRIKMVLKIDRRKIIKE